MNREDHLRKMIRLIIKEETELGPEYYTTATGEKFRVPTYKDWDKEIAQTADSIVKSDSNTAIQEPTPSNVASGLEQSPTTKVTGPYNELASASIVLGKAGAGNVDAAKNAAERVGIKLTSTYADKRAYGPHAALDIAYTDGSVFGADVLSIRGGEVITADKIGATNAGKYVTIKHGDGNTSSYMHLNDVKVNKGDPVGAGELIGHVGQTGHASGPHLHLQIRDTNNNPINPLVFFANEANQLSSSVDGVSKYTFPLHVASIKNQ